MKLKIFLSSRNKDRVVINGTQGDSLTEIRKQLKKELESIRPFDKDFLDVRINEDFGAAATKDSYDQCLEEVQNSDFLIALYNGAAGWAPPGIDMGICHAELSESLNISARKTAVLDISAYFDLSSAAAQEKKLNTFFTQFVMEANLFNNPLKLARANESNDGFKRELLTTIKNIIYNHLAERIKLSNLYFNISGDNRISLNWKKLKYSDRDKNITALIREQVAQSPNFASFITLASSIPDNMSVEDAKSYTGRPFLNDQILINETDNLKKPNQGPLHFIGVYGNATEIQVKNLVGFPDIVAIKEDFGLYVWEQNTHVQLVFLTDCRTPDAVRSKFLLFNNWCSSNGEYDNMVKRAKARHHIITAINDAKKIVSATPAIGKSGRQQGGKK